MNEPRADAGAGVVPALRARVLHDTLPYVQSVQGKVFVILCEGRWLRDPQLRAGFGRDVSLLHLVGLRLVVVIGGSSAEPAELLRMRRDLVGSINRQGCRAVGLSAEDGGSRGPAEGLIQRLHAMSFTPVVSTPTRTVVDPRVAVQADLLAGRIAQRLEAEKLLILGDSPGVLDHNGQCVATLSARDTAMLTGNGSLSATTRASLDVALDAVAHGVGSAHFVDAGCAHALLLELLSNAGGGTTVLPEQAAHFFDDSLRYLNRAKQVLD
jgi:acetylglutamate kinase